MLTQYMAHSSAWEMLAVISIISFFNIAKQDHFSAFKVGL